MGNRGRRHPWRELRSREHIELIYDEAADDAGGAIYARRGSRAVIVLSPRLRRVERDAALAHELVHDDLGIVSPPAPEAIMERVESIVERRTADWLLPPVALEVWVRQRAELEAVTADLVAHEWDVPVDVAARALLQLSRRMS